MSLDAILTKAKAKPSITIIYGPSGLGKTTLAVGSKNPIVLQTEEGLGILTKNREIPHFKLAKDYDTFFGYLKFLVDSDLEYNTLVIDSLDWLEPLIHTKTCEVHKQASIESFGYGRGYNEALKYWREVLDLVNTLRNEKKMRVVLIAHNQIKAFHDPSTESYDRHELKLHKAASALVLEASDMCLFLNYKKGTVKVQGNKGLTSKTVQSGRVLVTTESPACVAKNRYGLPEEIQVIDEGDDFIVRAEKTWAEIGKLIAKK
jgi:hypothetical protein